MASQGSTTDARLARQSRAVVKLDAELQSARDHLRETRARRDAALTRLAAIAEGGR